MRAEARVERKVVARIEVRILDVGCVVLSEFGLWCWNMSFVL
jgi:hypothetical protein